MKKISFISIIITFFSFSIAEVCINNETGWELEYESTFFYDQAFYLFVDIEFLHSSYGEISGTGGNCIDDTNETCEDNPYTCDVLGVFSENESIAWGYMGGCDNCDAMPVIMASDQSEVDFRYYHSQSNRYFILTDFNGEPVTLDMIQPLQIEVIYYTMYLLAYGDSNSDGGLDILDVVLTINDTLSGTDNYPPQSDVNFDLELNIQDVVSLINIIFNITD